MLKPTDTPPRLRQEQIIAELIRRHHWRLLDGDTWIERANKLVAAGIENFAFAARIIYSSALYRACSGLDGDDFRDAAHEELWRYIYDAACFYDYERANDLAQSTFERVLKTLGTCRHDVAFFSFIKHKLRDAHNALIRHERKARGLPSKQPAAKTSNPQESNPQEGELHKRIIQPVCHMVLETLTTEDSLLAIEDRARLEQCRQDFIRRNPKAEMKITALWYKFIYGLDNSTIGLLLGTTAGNAGVLCTRAQNELRSDPDWRDLAREFGYHL